MGPLDPQMEPFIWNHSGSCCAKCLMASLTRHKLSDGINLLPKNKAIKDESQTSVVMWRRKLKPDRKKRFSWCYKVRQTWRIDQQTELKAWSDFRHPTNSKPSPFPSLGIQGTMTRQPLKWSAEYWDFVDSFILSEDWMKHKLSHEEPRCKLSHHLFMTVMNARHLIV